MFDTVQKTGGYTTRCSGADAGVLSPVATDGVTGPRPVK